MTGGRGYGDSRRVDFILSALWPFKLGHGNARGADSLCEQWVRRRDPCAFTRYPAEWTKHGKSAGPIRNRFMLDDFKPHILVAFPGGSGTADCVAAALSRGIPVWRV